MHCKKILSAVLAGSLLLAGCDKDPESYNFRLKVYPSLGELQLAKVRVYEADGRTLIGKGYTGTVGEVELSTGPGTGPILIKVFSDGTTTYFDESLDGFVGLPAGEAMHALVPSRIGAVAVTPLTDLAYRIAVAQGLFPLTANEVNELNERVRTALAPELNSIIRPVTILGEMPVCSGDPATDTCLDDTQENRYALRLAAMALLGNGEALPAVHVMNALRSDILDADGDGVGVIDGLDRNGDPINQAYDPNTLVPDVKNLLSGLAGSHGSPELQAAVADAAQYPDISLSVDLANIDDGSNFSGCSGVDDPNLPAALKNQSFHLTYQQADATSPYTDEEMWLFTFCSNGQLRIGYDYEVLTNVPYETVVVDAMQTNYTWKKVANNMDYEVVVMNGALYEINIYGENRGIYYGQFVP